MTLVDRANNVADGDYSRAAAVYWHALGVSAQVLNSNPPPQAVLDDADDAQKILERRFPGIDQVAHIGPKKWAAAAKKAAAQASGAGAQGAPPKKPPARRSPSQARRAQPSPPPASGSGSSSAASKKPPARGMPGRRGAHRSSNPLSRALRTGVRDTGLPAAARSTTRTALNFVGAGFGLSILYLLLTNAERSKPGRSAVELVGKGLGRSAQVLVSPAVDPLSPSATATKPADLSGVNAAVDAAAQAASSASAAPIVPGITPLLAPSPTADLAQSVLAGVRLPHLAAPYRRPPAHVRQPAHPRRPGAAAPVPVP